MLIVFSGDLTALGEGGVSLTTDQRTRVGLARAAYCESDIYLFDDCFSSLTNSAKLVKKLIVKRLSQTCRLIVSNNDAILQQCDHVILIDSGRIKHQGTFSQVKEHVNSTQNTEPGDNNTVSRDLDVRSRDIQIYNSGKAVSSQPMDVGIIIDDVFPVEASNWSPYLKYLRKGRSVFALVFLMLLVATAQGILVVSDWWLAKWSNMKPEKQVHKQVGQVFYGICSLSVVLILLRSLGVFLALLKTSQRLHSEMLKAVLKAHVSFFDSNSPARIVQR